MLTAEVYFLIPLIFLAAMLFSSVGHGGASAYLAAMALMNVAPASMRPAALVLNILVASIAIYKFYRADAFSWRLFVPLSIASVPAAFIGGLVSLPNHFYKPIVGLVLIFAAWHIFIQAKKPYAVNQSAAKTSVLLGVGAILGLLSGLTGIGGGVFLSPILLFYKWAETKVISGVAAAFILMNSIAGLIGVLSKQPNLPAALPYWAVAAVIGGLIGAEYGSRRLTNPSIRKLLALVLLLAGGKMMLAG
ncbi:MAG: sulfite exporter TauE/SafE family protein [Betaproteobacteria bacterium]